MATTDTDDELLGSDDDRCAKNKKSSKLGGFRKIPVKTESASASITHHSSENNTDELSENFPMDVIEIKDDSSAERETPRNRTKGELSPLKTQKGNDSLSVAFSLENEELGINTGVLQVKAGGEKPMLSLKKHDVLFTIMMGRAQIAIGDGVYNVAKGEHIHISKGDAYSIKNLDKRKKLKVHFMKFAR